MITSTQLRDIALIIDTLNKLETDTALHLYTGGGDLYIDDQSNVSLVRVMHDEDGYTIAQNI